MRHVQAQPAARGRLQTYIHDGLTFDVIDEGPLDGPIVIALHGFPERAGTFREMIPPVIDAGFRVLAPDQRGYSPGARPKGVKNYTMDRLVGDVLALADEAGADTFHVLGHDWGAAVAWELAGAYPDRILTMTALSVPNPHAFVAALPRGQLLRSWYMVLFQLPWLPEKLMKILFELALSADRFGKRSDHRWGRALAHFMEQKLRRSPVEGAYELWREDGAATATVNWYRAMGRRTTVPKKVRVPTLYVWSTGDFHLGRAAAMLTARHVRGPYRFEVLHGVSHWIPKERPREVATMFVEHVAEHG